MRCSRASLVRSTTSWAQKSKSICSARLPYGIAPVVSPRAVTNSTMPHQWFDSGASASFTLPTIWVHRCSVLQVSCQSA